MYIRVDLPAEMTLQAAESLALDIIAITKARVLVSLQEVPAPASFDDQNIVGRWADRRGAHGG